MKKVFKGIVLAVAAFAVLYSGYKLGSIYLDYYQAKKAYKELSDEVVKDRKEHNFKNEDNKEEFKKGYKKEFGVPPEIDWDELLSINGDVCGWIWIPDVDISYPIMYSKIEQYYLRRDINKNWFISGSIFIDHKNKEVFSDVNTLIYGHSMNNGTMFGKMDKFIDPKNYPFNPYIWILTPNRNYVYKMFTSYVESPTGEAYKLFSKETSDLSVFSNWINKNISRSTVPFEIEDKEFSLNDHIITLSSCYKDDRYRQITQAYLVYEDIQDAKEK